MIKYALSCACGARFEGWFRNAAACDAQLGAGEVLCPVCAGAGVEKTLMAPSIGAARAPGDPKRVDAAPPDASSAPAPDGARKVATATRALEQKLRALRAFVEATAEPVGPRFAAEARAIHEGEAPSRPIYGEASAEEAEALRDDGVPVAPIPWIDRTDD